jgi:hypothetical protein
MKDIFTFNLISLFAFSSVLMTYFGVNYYLSGMHSYASGDSVPVPSFVYIIVIVLAALSFVAYSMGWKMGLEPTTFGTTIRRSNRLNYIHRFRSAK